MNTNTTNDNNNNSHSAVTKTDEDSAIMDCYSDGYDYDVIFNDEDNSYTGDDCFLEEKDDDHDHDAKHYFKSLWHKNYTILREIDIRQRMQDAVNEVSTVLSLSKAEASFLLCQYNWSVSKVYDAWFADEPAAREKAGLLEKPVMMVCDGNDSGIITCGICFESYPFDSFSSASCGHPYCSECWSNYISMSINDSGVACLKLRCPEPSCKAAVTQDLIESSVSQEDYCKYSEFLIVSYVEENRKTKWCPSPGCECAVELIDEDESLDVTCHCFASFCWNCTDESHQPVDCETVKKWIAKNNSESENVNYILAYCKPCPKCKRPIEKNEGCSHMHCKVCQHRFCWICLQPLNNHKNCNGFTPKDTVTRRKEMAKQSLEKYTHYFERWDVNRKSKLKAVSDFQQVKNVQLERISEMQNIPVANLDFITKAWVQIVECRRVLEWSYAYGYYMADNNVIKKEFFEYLQGEAESTLEKLHNLAERELERFLAVTESSMDLTDFRTKLVGLTTVTGNYFNKLVTALENGLSDVGSHKPSCSRYDDEEEYWLCDRCTYANPVSAMICEMCSPE